MGEIYVALIGDLPGLQKLCALKKIRPALSHQREFMRRFWDEGKIVISLSHPNIVNVYEIGQVDEEYFLAMELVEGHDLSRVLSRAKRQKKRFEVSAALYVARELLAALQYCHELTDATGRRLEVVHRDVSPGNVMISYDGRVKLTDFGLALSAAKEVRTRPNVVFGKPGYLAPEQLARRPADHRVDVFSVGVLLFEMLTGERFVRSSMEPAVLLQAMRQRSEIPPSELRRAVPEEVDALVTRAVAIDPADRFGSAREFHDQVQLVLSAMDPLFDARRFQEAVTERVFPTARSMDVAFASTHDVQASPGFGSEETGLMVLGSEEIELESAAFELESTAVIL